MVKIIYRRTSDKDIVFGISEATFNACEGLKAITRLKQSNRDMIAKTDDTDRIVIQSTDVDLSALKFVLGCYTLVDLNQSHNDACAEKVNRIIAERQDQWEWNWQSYIQERLIDREDIFRVIINRDATGKPYVEAACSSISLQSIPIILKYFDEKDYKPKYARQTEILSVLARYANALTNSSLAELYKAVSYLDCKEFFDCINELEKEFMLPRYDASEFTVELLQGLSESQVNIWLGKFMKNMKGQLEDSKSHIKTMEILMQNPNIMEKIWDDDFVEYLYVNDMISQKMYQKLKKQKSFAAFLEFQSEYTRRRASDAGIPFDLYTKRESLNKARCVLQRYSNKYRPFFRAYIQVNFILGTSYENDNDALIGVGKKMADLESQIRSSQSKTQKAVTNSANLAKICCAAKR